MSEELAKILARFEDRLSRASPADEAYEKPMEWSEARLILSANREMREREEGLRLELAKHDASYAECRIDGARPQSNTARPCDLCGARSSEPCGRKASASYAFIKAARSALTTQRGDGE